MIKTARTVTARLCFAAGSLFAFAACSSGGEAGSRSQDGEATTTSADALNATIDRSGCVIYQEQCINNPGLVGSFYDWDAQATVSRDRCMQRARDIGAACGNFNGMETKSAWFDASLSGQGVNAYRAPGCFVIRSKCAVIGAGEQTFPDDANAGSRNDPTRCAQRAHEWNAACQNPPFTLVQTQFFSDSPGYQWAQTFDSFVPGCRAVSGDDNGHDADGDGQVCIDANGRRS